jgi:hypothetical protein
MLHGARPLQMPKRRSAPAEEPAEDPDLTSDGDDDDEDVVFGGATSMQALINRFGAMPPAYALEKLNLAARQLEPPDDDDDISQFCATAITPSHPHALTHARMHALSYLHADTRAERALSYARSRSALTRVRLAVARHAA